MSEYGQTTVRMCICVQVFVIVALAAGPCLVEDTCSDSDLQDINDAIDAAYGGVAGYRANDARLNFGDDYYDYGYIDYAAECGCENESPYRHRRAMAQLDSSIRSFETFDASSRTLKTDDILASPPLQFGSRKVHFQHPTEVKAIRERKRRDGWRFVGDGEADQYDWGNYISTSLCGGQAVLNSANSSAPQYNWVPDNSNGYIYYRLDDECAVTSECFGPNSSYRMNVSQHASSQHLFHMRASVTTDDPDFFFIVSGNLGADGKGNSENFTLVSDDGEYVGFAWQTCNGPSSIDDKAGVTGDDDDISDASVNHLIIVKKGPSTHQRVSIPGEAPHLDHENGYWRGTYGLDQYYQVVHNIPKGPLSYYLWYGYRDRGMDTCWNESNFKQIFDAATSTTCSVFDCSNTRVCSTGCDEMPYTDNCTILGSTSPPTAPETTRAPSVAPSSKPTSAPTTSPSASPTATTTVPLLTAKGVPTSGVMLASSTGDGSGKTFQYLQPTIISEAPGSSVAVDVSWGPLQASATSSSARSPAVHSSATLADNEVDLGHTSVLAYCTVRDEHFSTRVDRDRSRCYMGLSAANGSIYVQNSCLPDSSSGICSVTLNTASILGVDQAVLRYGLTSSMLATSSKSLTVHKSPSDEEKRAVLDGFLPFEDTFVLAVPSRKLYPGEQFDILVTGRGEETISYAKFAIDVSDAGGAIEIISGSVVASSPETWTLSPADPDGGMQMFILVKKAADPCSGGVSPCYVSQPGNQSAQPILSLSLRILASTAVDSDESLPVAIRIYEFSVGINPEVPPGGQVIVPLSQNGSGWVYGSAVGRRDDTHPGIYRNSVGKVHVSPNNPVAVIARTSSGQGTLFNIAPLTGTSMSLTLEGYAIHPFGLRIRNLDAVDLNCSEVDSDTLSVSAGCVILFTASHVNGTGHIDIQTNYRDIVSLVPLEIFAPVLPVEVSVSSNVLGKLYVSENEPLLQNSECAETFGEVRLQVLASFSNNENTTDFVDVTQLVRARFTSLNTSVATVNISSATVSGVQDGTTSIALSNELGSTTISVNASKKWLLSRLATQRYSDFTATWHSNDSIALQLHSEIMNRAGDQGSHMLVSWAEFVEPDEGVTSMILPLEHVIDVNFSASANVLDIIANGTPTATLLARMSGTAAVTASWIPPCSNSTIESTIHVEVDLPPPRAVWISSTLNEAPLNTIVVAHETDAASISGGVSEQSQAIGLVIDYGPYVETLYDSDDPVTYSIGSVDGPDNDVISISTCLNGASLCITPLPGTSGVVTIRSWFGPSEPTDDSLVATLNVTVIRALELSVSAYVLPLAEPAIPTTILRGYGDPSETGLYEQASIQTSLHLSNGLDHVISGHDRQTLSNNNTDLFSITGILLSVIHVEIPVSGYGRITAQFPGAFGNESVAFEASLLMEFDSTPNGVAAISDVTVFTSLSDRSSLGSPPTLYDVQGGNFNIVFSARFENGHEIPFSDTSILDSTLLECGLFMYNVSDSIATSVDNGGTISILQNSDDAVFFLVSAVDNTTVSAVSNEYYVNLKSEPYQVDLATDFSGISSGLPLHGAFHDDQLTFRVYLTSGTVSIGAIELAIHYDSEIYSFSSAIGGDDFNQNFGADGSTDPGTVNFGGVTTDYLSGSNKHIATITFDVTNTTAGLTVFSGEVISLADSSGNNENAEFPSSPFSFGDVGTVTYNLNTQRLRRTFAAAVKTKHVSKKQVRKHSRREDSCTPGIGPLPTGDVNGDCIFDTTDALIVAQYLLISSNGASAISAFFTEKQGSGVIQGSLGAGVMDADFNSQVMVSDVQHMIFVKFNSRRFVRSVDRFCNSSNGEATLTTSIERANSQDFSDDPADSENTRAYFVVTGVVPSNTTKEYELAAELTDYSVSNGRFHGILATTESSMRGVYYADFRVENITFGVSVLHVVRKAPAGWIYGYFSTGDPFDTINKLENENFDLYPRLEIQDHGGTSSISVPIQFMFTPMVLLTSCEFTVSPTAVPTVAPSTSPAVVSLVGSTIADNTATESQSDPVSESATGSIDPAPTAILPSGISVYTSITSDPTRTITSTTTATKSATVALTNIAEDSSLDATAGVGMVIGLLALVGMCTLILFIAIRQRQQDPTVPTPTPTPSELGSIPSSLRDAKKRNPLYKSIRQSRRSKRNSGEDVKDDSKGNATDLSDLVPVLDALKKAVEEVDGGDIGKGTSTRSVAWADERDELDIPMREKNPPPVYELTEGVGTQRTSVALYELAESTTTPTPRCSRSAVFNFRTDIDEEDDDEPTYALQIDKTLSEEAQAGSAALEVSAYEMAQHADIPDLGDNDEIISQYVSGQFPSQHRVKSYELAGRSSQQYELAKAQSPNHLSVGLNKDGEYAEIHADAREAASDDGYEEIEKISDLPGTVESPTNEIQSSEANPYEAELPKQEPRVSSGYLKPNIPRNVHDDEIPNEIYDQENDSLSSRPGPLYEDIDEHEFGLEEAAYVEGYSSMQHRASRPSLLQTDSVPGSPYEIAPLGKALLGASFPRQSDGVFSIVGKDQTSPNNCEPDCELDDEMLDGLEQVDYVEVSDEQQPSVYQLNIMTSKRLTLSTAKNDSADNIEGPKEVSQASNTFATSSGRGRPLVTIIEEDEDIEDDTKIDEIEGIPVEIKPIDIKSARRRTSEDSTSPTISEDHYGGLLNAVTDADLSIVIQRTGVSLYEDENNVELLRENLRRASAVLHGADMDYESESSRSRRDSPSQFPHLSSPVCGIDVNENEVSADALAEIEYDNLDAVDDKEIDLAIRRTSVSLYDPDADVEEVRENLRRASLALSPSQEEHIADDAGEC